MSQQNQGANSAAPADLPVPVKRKRGRPRKDESPIHGEKAYISPGSYAVKKQQCRIIDPSAEINDAMVGKVVSGVVEGSFDAGYLLTVKVGDTNTVLRGVVFKPGLSVPISVANDVAPHVKMFKRNEIPFSEVDPPSRVHASTSQSKQINIQPVKLLHRNEGGLPSNVSLHVNQVPRVAPQVLHSQLQDGPAVTSKEVPEDTNHVAQAVAQALEQVEIRNGSSARLLAIPLARGQPGDINQVIQVSSPAAELHTKKENPSDTSPLDETHIPPKGELSITGQVPLGMPQQAWQSELNKEPASSAQHLPLVKLVEMLQEHEVSALTGGPPGDADLREDTKSEPETEPSVKTLQGNETIDLVSRIRQHVSDAPKGPEIELNHTPFADALQPVASEPEQSLGSELESGQPVDDAPKGPEIELEHTTIAAARRSMATESKQVMGFKLESGQPVDYVLKVPDFKLNHTPIDAAPQLMAIESMNLPIKMLQENQDLLKCDRSQDIQSEFLIDFPRRIETFHPTENPISSATKTTEWDSQTEPKTSQPVEMLRQEDIRAMPYIPEAEVAAEQSLFPEVPEPVFSNANLHSKNDNHVSREAVPAVSATSDQSDEIKQ